MTRFIYTAKSKPKENVRGYVEAESEQDAINKITRKGYFPVSLKPEETSYSRSGFFLFEKVSSKDIGLFTRQLSSLIDAGVNIINSLNIIIRQTSNRCLKNSLIDIIDRVKDGKPLSESFLSQAPLFSNLYCAMIRTGEASGNLKVILNRLSGFLEKEEELKNSIIAALTYPFFVLIIGISTVLVLLVFVVPGLIAMFKDMGQVLPLPTRILIGVSEFFRDYGWLLGVLIILIIFLLSKVYRNPRGRLFLDKFKLKFGLLGQIVLKNQISRLMRSFSLLISSGQPVTSALEISASVLDNKVLLSEIMRFNKEIKNGASLSNSFENSQVFPEYVSHIVAIGEETGVLEKSLTSIAEEYEREVDRTVKAFTRLLEPVIILVIGLVVGFIVLSMLLPIFEINFLIK